MRRLAAISAFAIAGAFIGIGAASSATALPCIATNNAAPSGTVRVVSLSRSEAASVQTRLNLCTAPTAGYVTFSATSARDVVPKSTSLPFDTICQHATGHYEYGVGGVRMASWDETVSYCSSVSARAVYRPAHLSTHSNVTGWGTLAGASWAGFTDPPHFVWVKWTLGHGYFFAAERDLRFCVIQAVCRDRYPGMSTVLSWTGHWNFKVWG